MARSPGTLLSTWWQHMKPESFKDDALAALPRATTAVPDGMAAAALAGVNPIYGLYAGFAGPIAGGLTQSTQLMVITTTAASALAISSALAGVPAADRVPSMFLLVLIAGILMLLAGLFGLGRFVAFVSHSVMVGFLSGIAVNILTGQIADLTGAAVEAQTNFTSAVKIFAHPSWVHIPSFVIGLSALILLVTLPKTPLRKYAALTALVVPTGISLLFGYFDGVARVEDVGEILRGLPMPALPSLSLLSLPLVIGSFSVAIIVLVQGAGVAESAPNPDHSRSDSNQDFVAQGWANIASSFFHGLSVGASVSQTALSRSVGARSRWASIMSGVWVIGILLLLSSVMGLVAMPTLAAILIIAAIGALRPSNISMVWASGAASRIAMVVTFVATLFLPVAAAVGIGALLSLLMSVSREAFDVRIAEVVRGDDGEFVERPAPRTLESDRVTILHVYGSLFFAGARTLENILPDPTGAERAVVVLRIRGRLQMGATAFTVLSKYADLLAENGGRLYLSGVAPELMEQFESSGRVSSTGPLRIVEATDVMGESTMTAYEEGMTFLVGEAGEDEEPAEPRKPWINRVAIWTKNRVTRSDGG